MDTLTGHAWLDSSAAVSIPTIGTQTDGSQYPSANATAVVACTVQPHTGTKAMEFLRLTGKRVSLGLFDPLTSTGGATSITRDATLAITDRNSVTRTYRALGPHRDESGQGVVFTCDLEELS